MLKLKLLSTNVFLFASILAPAASATTITFGTGGTSGFTTGGSSVVVNDAAGLLGLTVTVTPGVTTTCAVPCLITASSAGYGVTSSTGDNADIDGSGLLDTITIAFNQTVTLTSVTFGNWDNNDNSGIYNGATLVTTHSTNTPTLALSTTGTSFQFRATGSNDDFQLQSITFSVATPEPTTFALMGVALMGLGFAARKRTQRS